jgi:hypothetical protein
LPIPLRVWLSASHIPHFAGLPSQSAYSLHISALLHAPRPEAASRPSYGATTADSPSPSTGVDNPLLFAPYGIDQPGEERIGCEKEQPANCYVFLKFNTYLRSGNRRFEYTVKGYFFLFS